MTVRTRIAPSPTGDPHVGTAYIALFNYAFAKAHGGQFVLRIEDTDQVRSTQSSEQAILDALRWIGLSWDEGPDVGGPHGPYRQSERAELYATHAQLLVDQGHAFPCFCTPEALSEMRQVQMASGQTPKYDGRCMHLSSEEVAERKKAGTPYVIRMRIPDSGECVVRDRLRGEIVIPWSQVDMQVLQKADGLPTYHLANVVDDHLMGITHVIRGEEWIPSAPKHFLLYQYFGWEMPELCHLPLLRNPDQSKLSKRKNPTSILYYRDQGYLPEALLNYLGRMGWSMPNDQERFDLGEMIEAFDIDRVSLGGPVFDLTKLSWLNGQWIQHVLSDDELIDRLMNWRFSRDFFKQVVPHLKTRIEVLSDVSQWLDPLWERSPSPEPAVLEGLGLDPELQAQAIQFLVWQLEAPGDWSRERVHGAVSFVAQALGLKLKQLMPLVFLALSGRTQAISAFDLAVLIGPDQTRVRLREMLDRAGGVSKKAIKRLEKSYQDALEAVDSEGEGH